ncbi:MAG: hypothetical protein ACRYGL_18035 [Janthinobacterium lividum]
MVSLLRRSRRSMRPGSAPGDAAGLENQQEKTQIGVIEAHGRRVLAGASGVA